LAGQFSEDHESSSEHPDMDEDAASVYASDASEVDGDVFYDATQTFRAPFRSTAGSAVDASAISGSPSRSTSINATSSKITAAPENTLVPDKAPAALEAPRLDTKAALAPKWLQNEKAVQRREKLPKQEETEKSVSLWAIIKECIGKDLTRICLPVFFNEPLSALQKMAEEFEYAGLLERAAKCPRASVDRLIWIAVFAVSGFAVAAADVPKR
jgi:hypothetical protein